LVDHFKKYSNGKWKQFDKHLPVFIDSRIPKADEDTVNWLYTNFIGATENTWNSVCAVDAKSRQTMKDEYAKAFAP